MRYSPFSVALLVAALAVTSFTLQSCSVVGFVAGSIADTGKRDTVSIFDHIADHVGTVVRLRYSDSAADDEYPKFRGCSAESDSSYASRYADFLADDSTSAPLELGQPVTIYLIDEPIPKVGAFRGFLPSAIAIDQGDSILYSTIHRLEVPQSRREILGPELQWMVLNNQLPIKAVLNFEDEDGPYSMVNDEFRSAEALVPNHSTRNELAKAGLAVDLLVAEILAGLGGQ